MTRHSLSRRRLAQPRRSEPARPSAAASPLPNVLARGGRTCCKMSESVDLFTAAVGHETRTRRDPCSSTVASIFKLIGTRGWLNSRDPAPSAVSQETSRRADHTVSVASVEPRSVVRGMPGISTAGQIEVYPAGQTSTVTREDASMAPSCTAAVTPGAMVSRSPECVCRLARGDRFVSWMSEPEPTRESEPTDTVTETGREFVRYRGGANATTEAVALRE